MSGWQSGDLQVNGLRLHYTRTGGGKPPLVLLHGFSDDGSCWTPVAEELESDYDVIMPDARGHGLSDAPEHGYSPMDQATDLKEIITALKLLKPLILGHSMGAVTTMALAAMVPHMPRAILLEDPPAWWYPEGMPPLMTAEEIDKMRTAFALRKQQPKEILIAEQHRLTPLWSDAELDPWADSKLRLSPNIVEIFESDWTVSLNQITCPTLLITADIKLGAAVSPQAMAALKKIIPQLQVVHIADSGHSIHREQMKIYMSTVTAYLVDLTH